MRSPIAVSNRVAALVEWIGEGCITLARHLRRCPDCGRSTFYGAACKNL